MTLVVKEEDFRLTHGEPKSFTSTSDAGRAKFGAFCPECGTRIYHKPEYRKGTVSVKPNLGRLPGGLGAIGAGSLVHQIASPHFPAACGTENGVTRP